MAWVNGRRCSPLSGPSIIEINSLLDRKRQPVMNRGDDSSLPRLE